MTLSIDTLKAHIADIQHSHLASSHTASILAVSKNQPIDKIIALAAQGQRTFGENYVQEALQKIIALHDLQLEWHFIGALQSNKCQDVAKHFDWVESVDRLKLIPLLNQYRPTQLAPLNVLIQVKIDNEISKSGAHISHVPQLCTSVSQQPHLKLRGLMCIPAPIHTEETQRHKFKTMRLLFDQLRTIFASIDTLSMGMSDDYELAIAEGATQIRLGTLLFGTRSPAR